ncbi:MAG: Holliday junction branch migration protein RuvA [Spirochaetia bacterium]|nr:Holliday junction branch migration protein RuvA [Spirochaetia bacterium]MCF7940450.1 Holliday junction branch migration protein RuvA [Spirochaetia bacterium]
MIDAIHGELLRVETNTVVIGTPSIDFACTVSSTTSSMLGNLGAEDRQSVHLYTHLHHKEDVMQLFGFATRDERTMFFEVTKVQGIGPKQAVKILSGISVRDLAVALDAGDIDRLTQIPGLGKKTAQKMILALRSKLDLFSEEIPVQQSSGSLPPLCMEMLHALTEMGYDKRLAKIAVTESYQELSETVTDDRTLEERLFKASIIRLA